jgi:L-ribulose-5-phosphate 4-epimerase
VRRRTTDQTRRKRAHARGGRELATLRASVLWANRELARRGLAPFTFGNASAIDRTRGLVVIKPSGVPYESLRAGDLVVTDLDGGVIEGRLKPSSDLPTHLELYRAWPSIGAVVHAHSHYATVWAQACQEIPCYGTTHADCFNGPVPVTRALTRAETTSDYERNTGRVIVERFDGEPTTMPAVVVAGHASFVWGPTVETAVETATLLEEVARLAFHTAVLNPAAEEIPQPLLWKHYGRKHGPNAYYGQPESQDVDRSARQS